MKFTDDDFAASVSIGMSELLGRADRMRDVGETGIQSTRVSGGPGHRGIDLAVNVANERLRWFVNWRGVARRDVIKRALQESK